MSSTAVDTSVKMLGGPSTMARPYPASWASDAHFSLRDPALRPPHFHGQPPQNLRLPPPSPVPGVPGNHGPSQAHSPLDPRFGPGYQSAEVPTSAQPVSHPPPTLGLPPSHHSPALSSSRQTEHGLQLSEQSPLDPRCDPRAAVQTFHNHQMPRNPHEHNLQDLQPPVYTTFAPRPIQPRMGVVFDPRNQQQTDPTTMALTSNSSGQNMPHPENRPDPMRIADLLSADGCVGNGGRPPSESDVRYFLTIRQQPAAARSCGFGERDRRVIDPPPIVQLSIECPFLTEDDIKKRLRYCHYIMSCSILDESGTRDASFMPEEYRQQRRLMGSLVGAPFVGKDEFGVEGCFFCFPDLSCRTPGSFRLNFTLVMIDPTKAKEVKYFPVLVEAKSEVFTVYSAKDFPGMQASTRLTKRLKEQGCIISIKKGNDKLKSNKNYEDSSDGEQDEEGESSQGKKQRRSSHR